MSASHPRYRLKLYGQTTNDPDRFAQKAAVLLGMSSETVHRLMRNLPVILKKNLDEDRAEFLKQQLDALGALTIIEPMEELAEEGLPAQAERQIAGLNRLKEIWGHGNADPEARLYIVLLIGATILLSSIITFGYSASLVKLFRQQAPVVISESASSSARASRFRSDANYPDSSELVKIDSRIDELDVQYKTLQFQYEQADKILQQVNSSFTANPDELFERSREVADLRNKIREVYSELMELRAIRSRSEG